MAMEDSVDSCSSRAPAAVDSSSTNPRGGGGGGGGGQQHHWHKLDVYSEVLRRIKESGHPEAVSPSFDDDLWSHFNRLPARYAMDVNVERAEDVLTHKHLLDLAHDPANRPVFTVRLVQVSPAYDGNQVDYFDSSMQSEDDVHCFSSYLAKQSIHPPPAFGSSPNLESLAIEANKVHVQDGESVADATQHLTRPMHEITFSTDDKPKLLSQLTCLLAEIGLNIQEAHAFSTNDGYSLDVFVVEGWPYEETEQLRSAVQKEIQKIEKQTWLKPCPWSPKMENEQTSEEALPAHVRIPTDGTDVWEIDFRLLKFENKVASGSYGDLYRGTYCSQEVAIKVLKPERVDVDMQREFAQEVYIMRKVRNKNVVQFIGACTRPPSLCIVTEFMSGGSIYDFLHKQKGVFKLPTLLRVAIDISKGMNYLHQNNIIHRDLKAANLLMDENEVVKVADFGVARVKSQTGVMTAETGTYRWMAPEVIEHKPYDHKADIFSFGVVLWELLTGKDYCMMSGKSVQAVNVYRQLLKAVEKHIGKDGSKRHFRDFVTQEFRSNAALSDQAAARRQLNLARDYVYLLNSVHHQKELLFSYNIAVDRSDEMKKILNKSAASVGLQLPDVYQA